MKNEQIALDSAFAWHFAVDGRREYAPQERQRDREKDSQREREREDALKIVRLRENMDKAI